MAPPLDNSRNSEQAESFDAGSVLSNEWYVLSRGIKNAGTAFVESANHAWNHKRSSALEMGVGFAAGLGLGLFAQRAGAIGLIARGLGAAAGLSFIYGGFKPWKEAGSRAWNARNKVELDAISGDLSNEAGRFAFDALLMTPAAIGGTFAGARIRTALSEGKLKLPKVEIGGRAKGPTGADIVHAGAEKAPEAVTKPSGVTSADGSATANVVETVKIQDVKAAGGATAIEATDGALAAAVPAKPGRLARYKFEQLDPASNINPRFDFGVEVSDPRLLNGQPNLDHHGSRITSETPSAAEQALDLPAGKLPKPGSVLATIRPDADSITAMAVLANRLEGRPINVALVREIGRLDRGLGPSELSADPDVRDMINAIRRKARFDDPIHTKVFFVKDVLDGSVNMDYVQKLSYRQRELARDTHARLDRDLKPETVIPEKVVFVKSDTRIAMGHGYRYAPVVILEQETPHFRRFSVGVKDGSQLDKYFGRAIRELHSIEPGWGGRSSIFGSPQDRDSKLTPQQVIGVVKKYIDPPAYKRYLWDATEYLSQCRPFKWFVRN